MAGLFDTPTTPSLRRLLEEVAAGSILIPEFQRPFVWNDQQRLDLLDSVARGLPIGGIMVWRTREHRLKCYERLGPFLLPEPSESGPWTYLIDGHQRLTTLFAALMPLNPDAQSDSEVRWPINVDLRETPPHFLLPGRGQHRPHVVPAGTLSTNARVYQAQKPLWEGGHEDEATRLEEVASSFRDYVIPLIPLVSEDIGLVTHAFARVNRGGTSMSEAHLASALAYGKLPVREGLEELEILLAELGWRGIGQGELLNGLKLRHGLDVYRATIPALLERLGAGKGHGQFTRDMALSKAGLQAAFSILESAGVLGSFALPYTYQALLLCEALVRLGVHDTVPMEFKERGRRWFWQTTFSEAFTGATGSRLREGLDSLTAYLAGDAASPYAGMPVRVPNRHARWGSVRTVGRMLALAVSSREQQPLTWLGYEGGQAVYKVLPKLETSRIGSWVIADVTALRMTRDAIERFAPLPRAVAAQMSADACEALQAGDHKSFTDLQEAHVMEVERRVMEDVGLLVTEPE